MSIPALSSVLNMVKREQEAHAALQALSQIEHKEKTLLSLPQAECSVVHHFGPGLCVREVFMPAGTLAIGHHQKFEHMNVMLKGKVMVVNDDGSTQVLTAPLMFIGKPGRKIGYVMEDMVWQNIYATDLKNPDDVETHFVEKSQDWQDDHSAKFAIESLNREKDRQDYFQLLDECGISHETALQQSENIDDFQWIDNPITRVSDSPIQGKGLFVTQSVNPGDMICKARISGIRTQAGKYTNHSATPNAKMVKSANGDIDLVAISHIEGCAGGTLGTEVTIDYRQALALSGVTFEKSEVLCQQ